MLVDPAVASALALQGFVDPVFLRHLAAALIFAVIGVFAFAIIFYLMVKLTPFSIRKEIEEDHNSALAIVMASVILGIAIIVGMAIKG